jgi:hypothetical protein
MSDMSHDLARLFSAVRDWQWLYARMVEGPDFYKEETRDRIEMELFEASMAVQGSAPRPTKKATQMPCRQCAYPTLKGIHTCNRTSWPEADLARSAAHGDYLRAALVEAADLLTEATLVFRLDSNVGVPTVCKFAAAAEKARKAAE